MAGDSVRERVVDAADRLFYGRGITSVGMDAVRDGSGVSLKAIYKEFPSKEDLVLAVLGRRHQMWTTGVEGAVERIDDPRERLLAMYDHLADWFGDSDFRGCGFINAFGELGGASPRIADAVREHKRSFQAYVDRLVADAGAPAALGPQLAILAEGAQTTAAISGVPDAAGVARAAARTLIDAAMSDHGAVGRA
ncbi:TetR/AcrR family transcriptional regulator [Nocardioides renjunii]|uniref:TetR/AcrR family transcriptional regulator n=1 Tax=Nocardioides renjunii TaxID=3095075 RepID=UPI002AFFB15A|nr:TetR/AcrR family transcriptional regulator [Nocardioides sp. S-34]WQQ22744.1 TetR/AcrR family transcriptional regulator [Nocardioides sp. S-34]